MFALNWVGLFYCSIRHHWKSIEVIQPSYEIKRGMIFLGSPEATDATIDFEVWNTIFFELVM